MNGLIFLSLSDSHGICTFYEPTTKLYTVVLRQSTKLRFSKLSLEGGRNIPGFLNRMKNCVLLMYSASLHLIGTISLLAYFMGVAYNDLCPPLCLRKVATDC